jgi:hypothetical protein
MTASAVQGVGWGGHQPAQTQSGLRINRPKSWLEIVAVSGFRASRPIILPTQWVGVPQIPIGPPPDTTGPRPARPLPARQRQDHAKERAPAGAGDCQGSRFAVALVRGLAPAVNQRLLPFEEFVECRTPAGYAVHVAPTPTRA